jgi:hypothetical protein
MWLTVGLCFASGSCSESEVNLFPTHAQAAKAGAVDRGWVPAIVPYTAVDIWVRHSVDANQLAVAFTSDAAYLELLRPLPAQHWDAALAGMQRVRFAEEVSVNRPYRYYYLCEEGGVALLLRNDGADRSYYSWPFHSTPWESLC